MHSFVSAFHNNENLCLSEHVFSSTAAHSFHSFKLIGQTDTVSSVICLALLATFFYLGAVQHREKFY